MPATQEEVKRTSDALADQVAQNVKGMLGRIRRLHQVRVHLVIPISGHGGMTGCYRVNVWVHDSEDHLVIWKSFFVTVNNMGEVLQSEPPLVHTE